MKRTMLRGKIHRVRVTACDLDYEGSLTLDLDLLEAADMIPFERVDVYDIENGNRFTTYLMQGERGTGECCVNGQFEKGGCSTDGAFLRAHWRCATRIFSRRIRSHHSQGQPWKRDEIVG